MEKEKSEKKDGFGKDKYGRPFEFASNSIPKLMNREAKRKQRQTEKKRKG